MAEHTLVALLFLASGGLAARPPLKRATRARTLLRKLAERCEARGGACDCGMHRKAPS